jgi:hypothetical protein
MKFLRWMSQKNRVIRLLKAENSRLRMELALVRIEQRFEEGAVDDPR